MTNPIRFELNGKSVSVDDSGGRLLLWALRTDLGLTGAKYGCGEGHCGACTVLVDGRAVRACVTPLRSVAGRRVTTVEGLAQEGRLHRLQQAFLDHGALQCGYCTPGMLMAAAALLAARPDASRPEIQAGLEGHLCRCGAHQRIVDAVAAVAGAPVPAAGQRP